VQADIAIPGALAEIAMVAARPGLERKVIIPEGMKTPELPYSWGILAGNTLFIAGATSRNPETYQPVTGDTATQTKQVMENIGAVLRGAGMDYKDVVSCKVFLDDARDFQAMNEVYRTFFPEDPPARATVRARLMNSAFTTEIQCVAVKDPSRKVVVAEGASRSSSPFSPAIQVGDRLYLAGFVGRGPDGFAAGDVKAQTKQTLANLEATLKAAGMDFTNVVDAMVYLSDIRHYQAMNEVYREILPTPPPARATVGSQLMSPDALVEIMMVATR
jgi:2-iminobutanoate/2-iminopropanoate deaminase